MVPATFKFDVHYILFQDESLLAGWKQQLDRDSETLKMKGNLNCLRTVSIHYLFISQFVLQNEPVSHYGLKSMIPDCTDVWHLGTFHVYNYKS